MSKTERLKKTISSTGKTKKITDAMKKVATSKLYSTERQKEKTRPYSKKLIEVIGNITLSNTDIKHPYLSAHSEKKDKIGIIVVSSNRGLCGGLNNILFKKVIEKIKQEETVKNSVEACTIGLKAYSFLKKINIPILSYLNDLTEKPSVNEVIEPIQVLLTKYKKGKLDKILLFYNHFNSIMDQKPIVYQLLPIPKIIISKKKYNWKYEYEPNEKKVLNFLLKKYIESTIYQAVVENIASEQASRMIAMQNSSENAKSIIQNLKLEYNKQRQENITKEISEIVSGAENIG